MDILNFDLNARGFRARDRNVCPLILLIENVICYKNVSLLSTKTYTA